MSRESLREPFALTGEQSAVWARDGFLVLPGLFSPQETAILLAEASSRVFRDMPDVAGRSSRLSLWQQLGDDILAAVSASPRVVTKARQLLGGDIYHWHSKVMLKEARAGGAWEWHQDYGYWYHHRCPYPRMLSCLVALDRATRENGCLKVLAGSHRAGRVEHGQAGKQSGADPARVDQLAALLPMLHLELEPGDAVFFDCNLLHASEANTSQRQRTSFICCYNAVDNAPVPREPGVAPPAPIVLADDEAILRRGSLAVQCSITAGARS